MKQTFTILAGLMLLLAACGGDTEPADGIPTLDTSGAATATTAPSRLDPEVALLEFSQCMRDEGIDLPDIGVDAAGSPLLDPALLERIDIESAQFEDALGKCESILQQAGAFDVDLDPELLAQIDDQLVEFSQCMRDNGFADFPDPSGLDTGAPYPLSVLAQFSDPEFEAAVEICQRGLAFPGQGG
ncbi:MAG: hypothetical protein OEP52_03125 [Acidimicrobiia bacterium]|nr:hypothetical protein [Acidimicrobiia bacterium]